MIILKLDPTLSFCCAKQEHNAINYKERVLIDRRLTINKNHSCLSPAAIKATPAFL